MRYAVFVKTGFSSDFLIVALITKIGGYFFRDNLWWWSSLI